jgi:predicted translin family RNA/ssDNA-binding protein
MEDIISTFQSYNEVLSKEQETKEAIRKVTKEIDQKIREMKTILGLVHTGNTDVIALCGRVKAIFPNLKTDFTELMRISAQNKEYYQYRDFWKQALSQLVFIAGMVKFLEEEQLITLREVEVLLGLPGVKGLETPTQVSGSQPSASSLSDPALAAFAIEIVDYLYGLCFLPGELVCLPFPVLTQK